MEFEEIFWRCGHCQINKRLDFGGNPNYDPDLGIFLKDFFSEEIFWRGGAVSSRPHLPSANVGLNYSVTLPDLLMMSQQTRSFGTAAKLKMVSGHHPTGGVLEVDLPPPGFIRSAGTREYR